MEGGLSAKLTDPDFIEDSDGMENETHS